MPADPTIALNVRAPQIQSPLDAYGRAMNLRNIGQQAEMQQLQLEDVRRERETQSAAQRAIAQIKGGNAEAVLADLPPEARQRAQEWLTKASDYKRQRQALARKDLQERAQLIRSFQYDPTIAEVMFGLTADEYPEAASIWGHVNGDPAKLKQVVDAYADLGKEATSKTREVKLRNPDGTETIQIVKDEPGQTFTSAAVPGKKHPVTVPGPNGRPMVKLFTEEELAQGVQEYRAPTQAGSRFWVMRNGKPVRITEAQYRLGDQPANTREQGRPVVSGDANRIADFDTSLDDIAVLRSTLTETEGATGTSAAVGAAMPAWATDLFGWGTDAKKRQGVIDRVKQVIGKALEGGVLRKEDEYKYEKILPTIKDAAAVAASKLAGLDAALIQRRQRLLESLADAGYDTTEYAARPPRNRGDGRQEVPENVKTVLQSVGAGRHTLSDGSVWDKLPDGTIRKVQ